MPVNSPDAAPQSNFGSWKRLAIISASAGAGFAIVACLAVGGWLLWKPVPKPQTPPISAKPLTLWNTDAIKASFDYLDTERLPLRDDNTLVFGYVLENTTDSDYNLESSSHAPLMARLKRENSLSQEGKFLYIEYPVFVPAKQRTWLRIHTYGKYSESLKSDATAEERRAYRQKLAAFVNEKFSNLDGFVLFDKVNHYQINFPRGW